MDGETNGGQEATQGAQDQAQQQDQEQLETQQQGQSQVEAPDYEKQIAERDEVACMRLYARTYVRLSAAVLHTVLANP